VAPKERSQGLPSEAPKARSQGLPSEAPKARSQGLPSEAPKARSQGLPSEAPKARSQGLPSEAPKARRRVVRPLLDVGRDELRAYLSEIGQTFREDESNRDLSIPRNRIRHELLPLLVREYSPGITEILAREAALARDDEDRLQQEAIDLLTLIVLGNETAEDDGTRVLELDANALAAAHPAIGSRAVRLVFSRLARSAPEKFVGAEHVERVLELARDSRKREVSLPGQRAVRRGNRIVLDRRRPPEPFENSFRVSLSIPGEAVFGAWEISAVGDTQPGHPTGTPKRDIQPGQAPVTVPVECPRLNQPIAAEALHLPLAVRARRPGDRLRPFGMGGREKKLQDVLVDRKVAREERDLLPLVVDSTDRIVWVVGGPVAEDFRVTEASQAVIFLKARRLGGQG
jgi:tRNA(Ile)-lysidine synthase